MKIFILLVACFFLGVFIGYYYRDASVEGEIREELYKREMQECERQIEESRRLLEMMDGNSWEEEWDAYLIQELMKEDFPF